MEYVSFCCMIVVSGNGTTSAELGQSGHVGVPEKSSSLGGGAGASERGWQEVGHYSRLAVFTSLYHHLLDSE